ncbi:MAG TPA: phytanoyl-CoA dioxygenase family protein [Bacteroidota bacterium]|nr:phytanoyl-CoA dioxygenase family protein [Bacteroidota bacterium]
METLTFDLTEAYPVPATLVAQYRRDGHILLRGVVPPAEVGHYRELVRDILAQRAKVRSIRVSPEVSMPLFHQTANVWEQNEEVRSLVFSRRLARLAAVLMGVERVRLYHDEALLKEPGGAPTPWHKDHYNWPLSTHHTIKLWLALGDIHLNMGVMRFASGTHRAGQFPEVSPSYEADELFKRIIHDHNMPVMSYAMKAGDASFHSGDLLHAALANESEERREALAIIYYEDGTRIMTTNHEHRRRDLEEFFPGVRPGDVAEGAMHPLLYSRED